MLKQLDYVDTRLASRIASLENELSRIVKHKEQIKNNHSIKGGTLQRLLTMNNDCEQNVRALLQEQKTKLIQYLDKQVDVVTRVNKIRCAQQRVGTKICSKLSESTKAQLSCDSKLDITRREGRQRIRSFQQDTKIIMDVGSKKRVLISRLKKKVKRQRNVIQALTLWIQMNDSWEKRDDSQYEINELLKNKNSLLQQRIKQLESELDAVRRYSEAKAQQILSMHKLTESLRNQNRQLQMDHKALLRIK